MLVHGRIILFIALSPEEHHDLKLGLITLHVTRLGIKKVGKVGLDWGLDAYELGSCSYWPQAMYKVSLSSWHDIHGQIYFYHFSSWCWAPCSRHFIYLFNFLVFTSHWIVGSTQVVVHLQSARCSYWILCKWLHIYGAWCSQNSQL